MHPNASDDRTPPHTAARAPRPAVLILVAASFLALAASAPADNLTRVATGRAGIPTDPPGSLPAGLVIPSYAAGPMPLHPGEQLVFRASWIGIPAAEARIVVSGDQKDPRMWRGEVWVRTSPGVDMLYKLRDYLREEFSRASMAPRALYIKQSENQRNSEYRLSFDRRARLVTAVKRNKKGSATSRFASDNPFGPVSGAIMALSQPLTGRAEAQVRRLQRPQPLCDRFHSRRARADFHPVGRFRCAARDTRDRLHERRPARAKPRARPRSGFPPTSAICRCGSRRRRLSASCAPT